MSSKTSREISAEKYGEPNAEGRQNYIVTDIDYQKEGRGGRGYAAIVRMEGRRETDGMIERSFMMGIGYASALLESAARFSAKRLAEIVPPADVLARLREKVLADIKRDEERTAQRRAEWEQAKVAAEQEKKEQGQ